MNSKNKKAKRLRNRKVVAIATTAFWLNFFTIIIVHNLTGTAGVHVDYSISKYVGLSFPSAIAFLIVNSVISFAIWKYLKPILKTDAQKITLFFVIISLVGLSLFPLGLFDEIIPEPIIFNRALISFLHVLTSRLTFILMAAFAALTYFLGNAKRETLVTSLVFMIYAAICIVCYMFFPSLFWSLDIIFESLYIALFFSVVLSF